MSFDFPSSPTEGQIFTPAGGPSYIYYAPAWQLVTGGSAAPFDANAYNAIQLNGNGEIDQLVVGNIILGANSAQYFTDMWSVANLGVITGSLGSPETVGGLPPGFSKYVRLYGTAAFPSLTGSDAANLWHFIEGYRVQRLAWGTASAQPITVSFWNKTDNATMTTMTVAIQNYANDRTYLANVPISMSWAYRTIIVPGCTDGTWNTDNQLGMMIAFCVACGPGLQGTNNAWNTGYKLGTAATGNLFSVSDKQLSLTGLVILPGTQAPTAAQSSLVMRPCDQELLLCQRYLAKRTINMVSYAAAGANTGQWFAHPVIMRVAPTIAVTGGSTSNISGQSADTPTVWGYRHYLTAAATGSVYLDNATSVADARL